MEKVTPKVGDTLRGDYWSWYHNLEPDNGFKDSSFPGCQFRVELHGLKIAINVKVTGQPKWNGVRWQSRCKIEFVGDGEPSSFTGGILYTDNC
jgi:hypothetical protein